MLLPPILEHEAHLAPDPAFLERRHRPYKALTIVFAAACALLFNFLHREVKNIANQIY